MLVLCAAGVGGAAFEPFLSVFVYYHFAVLRPQFLWQWALPQGVAWSFYVAVPALLVAGASLFGAFPRRPPRPGEAAPLRAWPPVYTWVAAFGVWVSVTCLTARDGSVAWPWFVENWKIFVMLGAAALLVRTFRHVHALYLMAAVSLAYIAFEVNYQYLVNHSLDIWTKGYGGYDNNGAGLMLAMGVPLCYFAFEGGRRWQRWAFLLLIPLLIHAVLMTYSRGAMLSLFAAAPVAFLRSRRRWLLAGVGLVLAILLIPVMAGKEIRQRFLTIEHSEVDESANLRRRSWSAAWQMAVENPVFGVGVRNSNLFSYDYGADTPGRTIHNQYLQVAADSGFVGAGLYVGVLASTWLALRRARRAVAGRRDDEARRVHCTAAGVEGALAVFCVGAWFLSLETFELTYLLILLAAQLNRVPLPLPAGEVAASADTQAHAAAPLPSPA
jgi:probable O-glycosylation ligase (exosortase A-associated)